MSKIAATEYKIALWQLMEQYFEAYSSEGKDYAAPIKNQYNSLASEAQEAYPNEECYIVDPWMWQDFSDYYKEVNGFRPYSGWSYEDVRNWLSQSHEMVD